MAEYIEREALLSVETCMVDSGGFDCFCVLSIDVRSAPAADVAPVVLGQWEDEYGGKYANPRYRCSVCKEKALYKFELNELHNYNAVQALTPSCPHCGAKMVLDTKTKG